jgi:hypothetical protein
VIIAIKMADNNQQEDTVEILHRTMATENRNNNSELSMSYCYFSLSERPFAPIAAAAAACQAHDCLFFLSDAFLPTPNGWLPCLSSLR